jgi:hypothetical protein
MLLLGALSLTFVLGCEKREESTSINEGMPPQPVNNVVAAPPILAPKSWFNKNRRAGNFQEVLEYGGLSFQAVEAHKAGSQQGARLDAVLAFWLKNQTQNNLRVKKATAFLFSRNSEPIAGFEMQPPKGRDWIDFDPGEAHVLPFWFKNDSAVPDRITVLVEREDQRDAIYAFADLNKMLEQKWDARVAWLKGTKFEGVDRIVHPRHYDMFGGIDTKSGSEIFIGQSKMENVFYDLGHDETWFESKSLDEKNPTTYFMIVPYDAARLTSAFQ